MPENDLKAQVDNLIRIGIGLSSQQNIDVLLEMIVDESRRFTRADAGTLYTVNAEEKRLDWRIVQNDTLGTRIGGTSDAEIDASVFKPVELVADGEPNLSNVSAYAANTGKMVNIPDVYEAEGFDFTGPRQYDRATGYRCQSMLVLPLKRVDGEVIGVLQLLNARDDAGQTVVPFSTDFEGLTASLASQAAVAMTNAQLIQELRDVFDAFIRAIASAIDEKSPYTAGHVRRVANLTMLLAEGVNQADSDEWRRHRLTEAELDALRIAAWMHDVGKITTPEHVMDKATKLATIYDRVDAIRTRYELLKRDAEIAAFKRRLTGAEAGSADVEDDSDLAAELEDLEAEYRFVAGCNTGSESMSDEDVARLQVIGRKTYTEGGQTRQRLTDDEVANLSIRRGTLTAEEREVINNHVSVTYRLLSQLPFPKHQRQIPEVAAGHHERLDGTGYPNGLTADDLCLEARLMAVADVFEALTAPDRPYRRPMPLSAAIGILRNCVQDGELDGRIVDLLVDGGIAKHYAEQELDPDQIDI